MPDPTPKLDATHPATRQYFQISPLSYGSADRFSLTYSSVQPLAVGQLVRIPLTNKNVLGVVTGPDQTPAFTTRPVDSIVDFPALPAHLTRLASWLAYYYASSPRAVWQALLPGNLTARSRPLRRSAPPGLSLSANPLILNPDQEAAVQSISDQPDRTYLLHGITGSGKTQVYIESAKKTLAAGRSVILLVPEIALGAQLEARFRQAFGDLVITNHSQLTPARRRAAWIEALTSQTPKVAIGPRSTLFLPFPRLGLIVIDECHETTYKQEQSPRYCADSVAAKLSQLTGAKLVLGSATPGLNQLYLTSRHRARLLELRTRPSGQSAPRFSVVDLRAARQKSLLSPTLVKAMVQTLDQKRQVLLFLNRRGTASGLLCSDCGWVARCPQCAISLTFHADQLRLLCHYCNFRLQPPTVCPLVDGGCGSTKLRYIGGGTKRIEAEAAQLFPNATIRRLDRDSATPAFLAQTLHDLHNGVIDILVGTQMIAKGFDLPAVDTVGIVSADTALHIPDYTASERTFQLILQAAGRTGRGDRPGHVVIQSYTPDHPAIVSAMAGDYSGFAARELSERQALNYPPFVFLLKLTCTAPTAVKAMSLAESGIRRLQGFKNLTLTGPAPTLRTFGSDKHQLQLIVRSKSRPVLVAAAGALPAPSWTVDLDPVNLL